MCHVLFFFFKQKTAYELRISDWSSDVCSSDLMERHPVRFGLGNTAPAPGEIAELDRFVRPYLNDTAVRLYVDAAPAAAGRSAERRVGKECVRTCRCGWQP